MKGIIKELLGWLVFIFIVIAASWFIVTFIGQRTQVSGARDVTMRLKDAAGRKVEVSFPDLPGEEFARMWERRELDKGMLETLAASALVLLVNGDTIRMPAWIVERMALAKKLGVVPSEVAPAEWSAVLAPTQVRVVDLLQMLMSGDLHVGGRELSRQRRAYGQHGREEKHDRSLGEVRVTVVNGCRLLIAKPYPGSRIRYGGRAVVEVGGRRELVLRDWVYAMLDVCSSEPNCKKTDECH